MSQMAGALEAIKLDMQQSDTADLIRPINRVAAAMQLLSKVWSGDSDTDEAPNKTVDKIKKASKPKAAKSNDSN